MRIAGGLATAGLMMTLISTNAIAADRPFGIEVWGGINMVDMKKVNDELVAVQALNAKSMTSANGWTGVTNTVGKLSSGLLVGGGLSYAVAEHVSLCLRGGYADASEKTTLKGSNASGSGANTLTINTDSTDTLTVHEVPVEIGVRYHFTASDALGFTVGLFGGAAFAGATDSVDDESTIVGTGTYSSMSTNAQGKNDVMYAATGGIIEVLVGGDYHFTPVWYAGLEAGYKISTIPVMKTIRDEMGVPKGTALKDLNGYNLEFDFKGLVAMLKVGANF